MKKRRQLFKKVKDVDTIKASSKMNVVADYGAKPKPGQLPKGPKKYLHQKGTVFSAKRVAIELAGGRVGRYAG